MVSLFHSHCYTQPVRTSRIHTNRWHVCTLNLTFKTALRFQFFHTNIKLFFLSYPNSIFSPFFLALQHFLFHLLFAEAKITFCFHIFLRDGCERARAFSFHSSCSLSASNEHRTFIILCHHILHNLNHLKCVLQWWYISLPQYSSFSCISKHCQDVKRIYFSWKSWPSQF